MKAKEVHKLSDEEVKLETQRLRKRLFELRTQAVTEKIQDTSQFRKVRKDIARVLTEASARRLATGRQAGAHRARKSTKK